jgi:hypothetical protein
MEKSIWLKFFVRNKIKISVNGSENQAKVLHYFVIILFFHIQAQKEH